MQVVVGLWLLALLASSAYFMLHWQQQQLPGGDATQASSQHTMSGQGE
jgi:hypothetical protein